MTARQLAHKLGMSLDSCSYVLWELRIYGLVCCLNPGARRSRLYWITKLGKVCQKELCKSRNLPSVVHYLPELDWNLYGWVCYSHRAAVIKTLDAPMQPAAMKRKARFQDRSLRMSANNVRDIIRLFLMKGIVNQVMLKGKTHPRYELTEAGKDLQSLLLRAGG